MNEFDITRFQAISEKDSDFRYARHLESLRRRKGGFWTQGIEEAVEGATTNIKSKDSRSFVIYGEPQSGKTEMMVALTARLLDEGFQIVIILLNDSVQLLEQNLERFARSELDPAPVNFSEILDKNVVIGDSKWVIFCKKNSKDLQKLLIKIRQVKAKVVIDDEADFATPNAKVNKQEKTRINELVGDLIGADGFYLGVTATPGRLDLNNTFENDNTKWIKFPAHPLYTGQDVFFPTTPSQAESLQNMEYCLIPMPDTGDQPLYLRHAMLRFFVNTAYLNLFTEEKGNYSILIHTSGKKADHTEDYEKVIQLLNTLRNNASPKFAPLVEEIWEYANGTFPGKADMLTKYVLANLGRHKLVVMNSDTDKSVTDFKMATNPAALFTIIIGGNIVSRGVTFNNLLSMYFTRDVKHKIQQDTYIQRARMFGTRGKYLKFFELHIPEKLYLDWQKCFVFHRLALNAILSDQGAPIWLEDKRISAAASSSINKASVSLDSGEMSWELFEYSKEVEELILEDMTSYDKMIALANKLGKAAFPAYVIEFINNFMPYGEESLVVHAVGNANYASNDPEGEILQRQKGLMSTNTLEKTKYPKAIHHIKIFKDKDNNARVFYRYVPDSGSVKFMRKRQKTAA